MRPLFINGPLHGFDMVIDDGMKNFVSPYGCKEDDFTPSGEFVIYTISPFEFGSGGTVTRLYIGFVGSEPSSDDLAKALLNEEALQRVVTE